MQIIVVSRHLKTARTIDIMPRHLLAGAGVLIGLVVALAMLFSWLSVQWRLPLVEDLLLSVHEQQTRKSQDYVSSNLQLMAGRLGELQARVLQLDALGERMSGLLGVKREAPPASPARPGAGQGGPYVPVVLSAGELLREAQAEKMGFSAYAVSDNMNDPMTKAIHALLDHAAQQDIKLQAVMQQLEKLGAEVETDAEVGNAFDVNHLNKIVD